MTLQRRDVSAGSASQSLKAKRGPEFRGIGDLGAYELGHGNHNSSDFDLGEGRSFCIFLLFG